MIAEQTSVPSNRLARAGSIATSQFPQQLDVVGALWRYRWAVVLPALIFGVIGFLVYVNTDETYRSSSRLMVESNRPPIFDTLTGEVVGGVPDIEVLQAQLYSDTLAKMAFEDPLMAPFRGQYDNDLRSFTSTVQEQLELEPEVTDVSTAQSLVTLLHFDSPSPEHSEAATRAYSTALQKYYDNRHQNTQAELTRLIRLAVDDLRPKLKAKEDQYRDFRRDAPLYWDSDGKAINPHRERQMSLTDLRDKQIDELRRQQTTLAQMNRVAENSEDPRITLSVMSELLGVKVDNVDFSKKLDPMKGDMALAEIDVRKDLIPLIVERTQNERRFGEQHPSVKTIDENIRILRDELLKMAKDHTDRITELRQQWFNDLGDPAEIAQSKIEAILYSHQAKVDDLQNYVQQLNEEIATSKMEAAELAGYESENEVRLRDMEQDREFLQQLQEQMGRVQLTNEESVTQIAELWEPSKAYLVGPVLIKNIGIGTLIGLMLGSGLAILLEKNANTFRDPEEISSMLEAPILTHIPFFRGKRRKLRKGEVDSYKSLTTDLAVVHQPSSVVAEAIRSLRTSVFFDTNPIKGGKVLQITSPLPGDGKSTIACNLACSIAQSGKRVLAIDCDLRRPQLTDNFDCDEKLGLTNVLNGDCDPLDATHSTPLPKMSIMPCGPIPSNPAEALSLPVMNELLDYLREHFDYIILDTPPLLVVTDPSITASMADALILTLRIRRKSKPNAKEAMNILNGVNANVLGVVVNNSDESNSSDGYRGYGYYKYKRYGGRYSRRNGQSQPTSVTVTTNQGLRRNGLDVKSNGASLAVDSPLKNGSASASSAQLQTKAPPVGKSFDGGALLGDDGSASETSFGSDDQSPFDPSDH